jgi:hypothetical protein
MAITHQQLRTRLFTLHTARGVEWSLGYLDHLEHESKIPLWVYCCGAEMQLRRQLPQRAQSLHEQDELGQEYREAAQARNATTQCSDGSWW